MAERSSSRKPQSLNDRHYRFLQDLSAPPKHSDVNNEVVPNELVKTQGKRNDNDAPQFSICDSSPEQEKVEKPIKVKVEGRRRLCKISSRADTDNAKKTAVIDEPDFSDVADFESPLPQPKNASSSDGGNEIRDILKDLSSKLEFLSIEKRKSTKKIELLEDEDQKGLVTRKEIGGEKKVDMPDYLSADSSFSPSPDSSDASSNINKNTRYGVENVVEQYKEEGYTYSESEGDNICRNGTRKASEKSVSEVEDEEEAYLQTEYKVDNLASRVFETKKSDGNKISKVSQVGKKSITLGKYSQTKAEDSYDDEEEDDCVVLSGKKLFKGVGAVNSYPIHYSVSSQVIELDDFSSDSPLEDKSTITLRGPKYNYKLPGKIAKMLYPHQRDGLRWLWSLHCQGKGGILGDDMGLGKTMQICGFLAGLFHSRLIKRAMVVAPKTLLSHWIKELSVVGLSEKTREYYGTCVKTRQYELQYILQDKGILLTTYDIVRNNSKSLRGDHYFNDEDSNDDVTWDYMILDEGHLIKNPTTQRAKSLLEIPSAHRIIISGTPIQNNLKELWALFNFSCPELLGDKKWFKETFENAILRGNEKNATDREKRIGSEVAKELRERIKPYFLRRLKNEVFNDNADQTNAKLSKKSEIIVWLKLTSVQRQLYEAFLKSELVLSAFDGSPLAALTILKKICDHPLLLTKRAAEDVLEGMDSMLQPEDVHVAEKLAMHIADVAEGEDFEEKHDNVSCKISFILSLLDELIPKGHNVLIFSQTRKMLNLIQESLLSNGYGFLRIDGTTKASDRVKIVSDFQDGIGAPIFLLTSQVGGLGLTLTRADRVIVVDPAWNPSTDNQSVDRAYRIGQTKNVIVYRLMTCGTVEEKIYRKQIYKGGLFKTATEQKEQIRYFSQQDLRELFSLPLQGFDVSVTQKQLHEEHDSQIKLDEFLKGHIQFLENQGIAGVSHHSLLFSKTAPPVQVLPEEEEVFRKKGTTYIGSSSSAVVERSVNGAEYAINPKDVKLNQKSSTPDSVGKLTESQIKERINRLSQTLTNQAMISRLPDGGEKIRKQIAELKVELCEMEKGKENEPIDLDDISGKLERVLNV